MQNFCFIVKCYSNSQSNIQNHVIVYLSDCFQISDKAKEKALNINLTLSLDS